MRKGESVFMDAAGKCSNRPSGKFIDYVTASPHPTFNEIANAKRMFRDDDLKFASLGFGEDLESPASVRCRECERKDPNRPGAAFCYLCGRKSPHAYAKIPKLGKEVMDGIRRGKPIPMPSWFARLKTRFRKPVTLYYPTGNVSNADIQRIADSLRGESIVTIPHMNTNAGLFHIPCRPTWISRVQGWWKYINGETPTW